MTHYAGIDLGTSNSAICTYDGNLLQVHKSPEQADVTPSAIYFDRRGHKFVGQRAYHQATLDPSRAAVLFKRMMGSRTPIEIAGVPEPLSPEGCSALMLQALFGYLPARHDGSELAGCVVTVPAAFDQVQKEATLMAAELAGIGKVALMQEPVAAVMSVMRARQGDSRFLIYDLGGGTLDIALAESVGGHVTLLGHGGVSVCGGRDIDRKLVATLVVPWLREQFGLSDDVMAPGTTLYRLACWAVERAKVELSARDTATIALSESEIRVADQSGQDIYLEVPISRAELDRALDEQIDVSAAAAAKVLADNGLKSDDIDRVVFVGGPTQYSPLREAIATELGISAASDVNAMTAVAEGAALFAEAIDWESAQRGRKGARGLLGGDDGASDISFAYTARTPAGKALVVARTTSHASSAAEFQIDCVDTGWTSGRLVFSDGAKVEVPLTRPGANTFKVFAFEADGSAIALAANRVVITRTAATVDAIPASHSVGIEVLEKMGGQPTLVWLVRAGDPLPRKGTITLRAATALKAGTTDSLNLKLWEGDIDYPIRDNRFIGALKILGTDFTDDVIAAGAELRCDFEVQDSGTITLSVMVDSIGAAFGGERNFYSPQDAQVDYSAEAERIAEAGAAVKRRLDAMASEVDDTRLGEAAARLAGVQNLPTGGGDAESSREAAEAVQTAKRLLNEVRQAHLKEMRIAELELERERVEEFIRPRARPAELSSIQGLLTSARRAAERSDRNFEGFLQEVRRLSFAVLWRDDGFVVDRYRRFAASPHQFVDASAYHQLVKAGAAALAADDMEQLRQVVTALWQIMVSEGVLEDDLMVTTNVVQG